MSTTVTLKPNFAHYRDYLKRCGGFSPGLNAYLNIILDRWEACESLQVQDAHVFDSEMGAAVRALNEAAFHLASAAAALNPSIKLEPKLNDTIAH